MGSAEATILFKSGGWDDYPAQEKGERLAPVVNSAHGIRIAKIMTMAAEALEQEGAKGQKEGLPVKQE